VQAEIDRAEIGGGGLGGGEAGLDRLSIAGGVGGDGARERVCVDDPAGGEDADPETALVEIVALELRGGGLALGFGEQGCEAVGVFGVDRGG